jgi:hypothetical protein
MVTLALTAGVIVLGTALAVTINSLRHRNNQIKMIHADRAQIITELDKAKLTAERRSEMIKSAEKQEQKLITSVYELKSKLRKAHQRVGKRMMPLGTNPDGTKV